MLGLSCNGAVGLIDWLDFRALLRDEFIIKFALAVYHLPAANWTSFYVTTEDVNLAFPDVAVVTGLPICSPVLFLISIANAVEFLASDAEARLNRVVHHGLINLTRIRLHLAIYFLAFPGRSAQKATRQELCRITRHLGSAMIPA